MKKKAKRSSNKRASRRATGRKNIDAAKVREEIADLVKEGAKGITEAVIDQAMHGELAPARYLFEVAGVYPLSTDSSLSSGEEDSLAKTLLDRLNIPDNPVVADQDMDEEILIGPAKRREGTKEQEESESASEQKIFEA